MELDAHLIGTALRAERERLGLTLKQAEADTRIRTKYLAALEDERFEELPGEAYVRGFLRCYATYLGLDGARYLAAYRDRTGVAAPPISPLPMRAAQPQGRTVLTGAAALALLAAVGFGAWKLEGRGDGVTAPEPASADEVLFAQRAAPPQQPAAGPAPAPARRPATALVLAAAGGDCRLEVRIGGPGGKLAWTGTLREGRTLRLGLAKALFVRAGSPQNLRATIGAQPQRVRVGAYGFVATRQGIEPRD